MAQEPATAKPMSGELLEQILIRARKDTAFRDHLLKTPEATLESVHVRPDKKWVRFLKKLTASNFESEIQNKIDNDPEGEAEAEAEA